MAPSFETLRDEDSYDDEDEEIDFSGACIPGRLGGLGIDMGSYRPEGAVRSTTRGGLGRVRGHRWPTHCSRGQQAEVGQILTAQTKHRGKDEGGVHIHAVE